MSGDWADLMRRIVVAQNEFHAKYGRPPSHFTIAKDDRFAWADLIVSIHNLTLIEWDPKRGGEPCEVPAHKFMGLDFVGAVGDKIKMWLE